ncbi:MAG: cysteine hydrolase [Rhodospirillales bacterium]|nr:cysteine hydrolase [Rhodospirillales bacterium]
MQNLPRSTALLIIDVQRAIDEPSWGVRNNPNAEANMAALLARWRRDRLPLYHIRHDSTSPSSAYRPGQPGNEFKDEVRPLPGEPIVAKRTNSAFIGTDLDAMLRARGQTTLIIAGVITNNSVEATVRMAGNLGYAVFLAHDATFTFGRRDLNGRNWQADEIHALSLANLHGEYCTVVDTRQMLDARLYDDAPPYGRSNSATTGA